MFLYVWLWTFLQRLPAGGALRLLPAVCVEVDARGPAPAVLGATATHETERSHSKARDGHRVLLAVFFPAVDSPVGSVAR